jgi:3-methyladenine DNA glycosylase AlkD
MGYDEELMSILSEIRAFCTAHSDPAIIKKYAKFFNEGYDAYGVPGDASDAQKKIWLAAYTDELGLPGFLALGDLLFQSGKYEEGFYAIAFASAFRKQFTPDTFVRASAWLDNGVCNWAHSDVLCGDILAYCLEKKIVSLDAMSAWRTAASKWRRRAVPVTMLILLKTEPDYAPLLTFLRPMMLDRERVVHQGLGWFLRDAWRKQPDVVEPFLLEYKDSAARLIYQYATEKMTAENKERFRKSKP